MMKVSKRFKYVTFLLLFMFLFAALPAKKAAAASLAKPKFKLAYYTDGKLILKWGRVSRATSYQILRSTKKNGKYKVFARTGSTSYQCAAKGYYYYRIRAVRGKKVSKMSAARHIFSAKARVVGYSRTTGRDFFKIKVTNRTKSKIYFRGPGMGYFDGNVYIMSTGGSILWRKQAYVTNSSGSRRILYAVVPGNSTRYVYMAINTNVPYFYLSYPFMTSLSFFPKRVNNKVHFAFGVNGNESSVASSTK